MFRGCWTVSTPRPPFLKGPTVDSDSPSEQPAPRKTSKFRRFDNLIMRFVGPANRSSINLRGNTEMSDEAKDWYDNLQNDFEMVKDANGRTYLRRRGQ